MSLKFKKLKPTAKLPTKGSEFSAGYDLYLAEDLNLEFDDEWWDKEDAPTTKMACFGVAVEIPEGYCGLLVERSSNWKRDLFQENKVGIIDSDYRGEIMAPISMNGNTHKAGERIAQLVIVPIFNEEPEWAEELTNTDRGVRGFGSTGE